MEEDNFTRARLESREASNYEHKMSKNNIARKFVDIYNSELKATDKIQEVASIYRLLEKGINVSSYGATKEQLSSKEIDNIYVRIKQGAEKNFVLFYQSYLRKIERGYYPEYIESALQDLKNAYHTLRRTNYFEWNCPDEMITITEMENLYLLITGEKKVSSVNKEQLK